MSTPVPRLSRRPTFPLIWVVPVIAAVVAAWMLLGQFRNRGPEIAIDFADGAGVQPDDTSVEYKGVVVGTVTSVALKKDLSGVTVRARLHRDAAALAREGSQFWIVHPEIGFSGIRGLDTLIKGVRISVRPGGGAPAAKFSGLDFVPPADSSESGRSFILEAERLGTLVAGAPVYFRDLRVGSVESSRFSPDARSVLIRVRILGPYVGLVRTNTRFWNAGGLQMRISLIGGAELRNNSLESLLSGAIAFATPDGPLAPAAPEGGVFHLYPEADKDWLKWRPEIPIDAPETAPAPARADVLPTAGAGAGITNVR